MKNSKKYVIWAPSYETSNGIRMLYSLAKKIKENGYDVSVFCAGPVVPVEGIHFISDITPKMQENDIVVYPEALSGNPLNFKHVVRWVLYFPGVIGGDKFYPKTEMVFSWMKEYYNAPLLRLQHLNHSLFFQDKSVVKDTVAYFVYKNGQCRNLPQLKTAVKITKDWPKTQEELATLLKKTKVLYSFDDKSALNDEALLCGASVKIVSKKTIKDHKKLEEISQSEANKQLEQFFEMTQDDALWKKHLCGYSLDDISVFVPTYNRPEFLRQSLQSLVLQTAGVPKIVVFNNGPLVETSEVIKEFEKYGVVEFKSSGGLLECMQTVQETMLKTPYVMFFHDDDILNTTYLENALKVLNTYPKISFITTRTTCFSDFKTIDLSPATNQHYFFQTQKDFAKFMYAFERIAMQTAIYSADIFKTFPRDVKQYGKFFDWPYLVTLSNYGNCVVFNDPKMFYVRIHPQQWSYDEKSSWTVELLTNWHRCFYDAMQTDTDSESQMIFLNKFENLFSIQYETLICDKLKKKYPLLDALSFARHKIINDKKLQVLLPIGLEDRFLSSSFEQKQSNKGYKLNLTIFGWEYKYKSMIVKFLGFTIYRKKNIFDKKVHRFYLLGLPILKLEKNMNPRKTKVYFLGIRVFRKAKKPVF